MWPNDVRLNGFWFVTKETVEGRLVFFVIAILKIYKCSVLQLLFCKTCLQSLWFSKIKVFQPEDPTNSSRLQGIKFLQEVTKKEIPSGRDFANVAHDGFKFSFKSLSYNEFRSMWCHTYLKQKRTTISDGMAYH